MKLLQNFHFHSRSRDMDEKPPKKLFYPTRSALKKHNFFSQVQIKKSVTGCVSPCIDEDNKKKP